ncbi:anti-sigma factor [Ferruginibacter sp.]|uniref:anti-sigma factor n=1 Tax=Ferruginibacter sp. TaxID=1940288 RepID=UPI00265AFB71|nr:anti-sigma factor [Ferruginibacter sp.]
MKSQDIILSGILELYAAGLASEEEQKDVQAYIVQYPEVAEELALIDADMESYAQALAMEPSASVKEKIFARINNEKEEAKTVAPVKSINSVPAPIIGITPYWKYAAAASVVLLLGSIALNMVLYNKSNDITKNLQQTQQDLAALKDENKTMEGDMAVVQNKYSKPVSLKGLEASPNAAAKIFWMENTGEVYLDPVNLPEAPAGKQYQLWGIVDGKPVSGGMILTSKKGEKYRIQKMKTFGKVDAFAITLESESGNTSPKGPMFVLGKM